MDQILKWGDAEEGEWKVIRWMWGRGGFAESSR